MHAIRKNIEALTRVTTQHKQVKKHHSSIVNETHDSVVLPVKEYSFSFSFFLSHGFVIYIL